MLRDMFRKKEKGITLIEVIVATFILLVAIVGSFLAFTQIIVATSSVSDRFVAAYLAQEGVEVIRNIRDTNWIGGAGWDDILTTCPGGGCQVDYKTGTPDNVVTSLDTYSGNPLNINDDGFYTYGAGTPTRFKRKITITPGSADQADGDNNKLDVLVEIMWTNRGSSYSFTTEEALYNWK